MNNLTFLILLALTLTLHLYGKEPLPLAYIAVTFSAIGFCWLTSSNMFPGMGHMILLAGISSN